MYAVIQTQVPFRGGKRPTPRRLTLARGGRTQKFVKCRERKNIAHTYGQVRRVWFKTYPWNGITRTRCV